MHGERETWRGRIRLLLSYVANEDPRPTLGAAEERVQELERALAAVHRELKWLRPGLDRPHTHRGVMREKVDGALALAERALARPRTDKLIALATPADWEDD